MEKKYYDLIISLIKEHRKFPGYEAILEDIANDVYNHAKVVIDSVSNDDVIIAYLNKVIATSIVTVPKKMNFNTKARHRVITTILQQATETVPVTPVAVVQRPVQEFKEIPLDNIKNEKVELEEIVVEQTINIEPAEETKDIDEIDLSTELTEEIESEPVDEVISEQLPDETVDLLTEQSEDVIEDNNDNISNEMDEEILEIAEFNLTEETDIDTPQEETFEVEDLSILNESDDLMKDTAEDSNLPTAHTTEVDKNLVDMMINGVPTLEEEEEEENLEDDSKDFVEENFETLDDLEILEDSSLEEISEVEEVQTEDSLLLEETNEENLIEDSSMDLDSTEPIFEVEDLTQEADNIIEEINESEPIETFSEEQDLMPANEDLDENLDIDLNLSSDLEVNEDFSLDLEETPVVEDSLVTETEPSENNIKGFIIPTFECFNYVPEKPHYDAEEIMSYLTDIDSKHPERNILTICDLKYQQKLSVAEIAQKLGISIENVIDVLNEIIDTVKD